jgi:hypothetical protein
MNSNLQENHGHFWMWPLIGDGDSCAECRSDAVAPQALEQTLQGREGFYVPEIFRSPSADLENLHVMRRPATTRLPKFRHVSCDQRGEHIRRNCLVSVE